MYVYSLNLNMPVVFFQIECKICKYPQNCSISMRKFAESQIGIEPNSLLIAGVRCLNH